MCFVHQRHQRPAPVVAVIAVIASVARLVGLASAPAPADAATAASAISPSNVPTPLPGLTNGELPSRVLINVAPGCETFRDAGPSLSLLLASAHDRGIALGTQQCYRPLSGQLGELQAWTAAGNSACAAAVVTSPSGAIVGTSIHGWGKAVDFSIGASFTSVAYDYLKSVAGLYGWNHPGWAEPGGSACPEAWHWEWVGDGGTLGAAPIKADVVSSLPSADGGGYVTITGLGAVTTSGDAVNYGDASSLPLAWVIVGAASAPGTVGFSPSATPLFGAAPALIRLSSR